MLNSRYLEQRVDYDGTQISSNWAYRTWGVERDSVIAFVGACDIPYEHMIDIEDIREQSPIFSKSMLHFIIERFELNLENIILWQRMLTVCVKERLEEDTGTHFDRRGDDIYDGDAKCTISIATLTPVSSKIHFGINVDSEGTPVKTKGLNDYALDPEIFGKKVMQVFMHEMDLIESVKSHVRGAL